MGLVFGEGGIGIEKGLRRGGGGIESKNKNNLSKRHKILYIRKKVGVCTSVQ
jgi:hypothetical protein